MNDFLTSAVVILSCPIGFFIGLLMVDVLLRWIARRQFRRKYPGG